MPSWSDGCYWDVTACRWVPFRRPAETDVGEVVADLLPSPRDSALPAAVAAAGPVAAAGGLAAAASPAGAVPAPGDDR